MTVSVCVGSSCHLKGARQVIDRLREIVSERGLDDRIEIKASLCMDNCTAGVSVSFGGEVYSVSPESAEQFFLAEILPRAGGGL